MNTANFTVINLTILFGIPSIFTYSNSAGQLKESKAAKINVSSRRWMTVVVPALCSVI